MGTIEKVAVDDSPALRLDSKVSEPKSQPKRRKVVEKTVVKVKIGENGEKLKSEGPPSDFWSWRKYGQKPIKGSPYPRFNILLSFNRIITLKPQIRSFLLLPSSSSFLFKFQLLFSSLSSWKIGFKLDL
uniref:WRKY super family protein n=1 Tax=Rhizophora mucronata TaxID=61149 RepID=A0A2P2LN10_RHIMU